MCLEEACVFVLPHPLWKAFSLFNQGRSNSGNVAAGKGYKPYTNGYRLSRGGRLERDQGLEGRSDQLAKQSLAILQVLLEEKIVSNSR